MHNTEWDKLSKQQLEKYAEYYAKTAFASYGLELYKPEVTSQIDFVVKDKKGQYHEIIVRSHKGKSYVYITKEKLNLEQSNLYVAMLIFEPGILPDMFLIPVTVWKHPNHFFVLRTYTRPEYGINLSKKNYPAFGSYRIENAITQFLN
ncbi:DUF4365 domain-containing protein [Caldalkalibacillus thermarum TA2.A1]|uniref:DUF4365 domain-containing protein n=1 Tax=Caldalkalibacillus thermarum (strain TA2.A1) TaxID=986075 RepID=A0A8X8I470_CALTT|nr:DUF4365 domain-containing protein [Caldalkalibacillus thermarum]QZT33657.1 DUF4365 domain-containing protein [Caldalkalibacillus thermarum TA2.A1]